MRQIMLMSFAVVVVALTFAESDAGWLIYHKPEFKGQVIDAETKESIEGAIVVVIYRKENFGYPGGGYTTTVKVKETLTDKKGEFIFPSYTTLIQPLSVESYAEFVIYKPEYKSIGIKPLAALPTDAQEIIFSEGPIGRQGEIREGDPVKTYVVTVGIAELARARTNDERRKARMNADIFDLTITEKKLPLLYEIVNDERKRGY